MPDEPTLGEALRRLDRIEERMVNRDSYAAERTHDRDEVTALRTSIAELRAEVRDIATGISRALRVAVTGVVMPIIVGIVLWVLTKT